jgi:hypothetical protein
MKFRCVLFAVPFALLLASSSPSGAMADDDYVPEDGTSYDSKKSQHGNSENFILGEKALKAGQTEKAIMYLRRSVNQKNDDFDSRVALATALEDKYRHQVEKDPDLFRECVSQWLYVLKTVAPEESGVSVLKFLYKDEERDMPAKVHIKNLTGKLPKPFETQKMFLARVCKGQGSVSGSVLRASAPDDKATDENATEDKSMDEKAQARKAPVDRDE